MRGLSLVVASGGHSSSRCAGLSLSRPVLLGSTGSRRAGSVIVAHGPSCSAACGIFPDQGSNPCALHWQADSEPLRHQGSPLRHFKYVSLKTFYFVSSIGEEKKIFFLLLILGSLAGALQIVLTKDRLTREKQTRFINTCITCSGVLEYSVMRNSKE